MQVGKEMTGAPSAVTGRLNNSSRAYAWWEELNGNLSMARAYLFSPRTEASRRLQSTLSIGDYHCCETRRTDKRDAIQ